MIWVARRSYREARQAHPMISSTETARRNWCASGEREEPTRGTMSPQRHRGSFAKIEVLVCLSYYVFGGHHTQLTTDSCWRS
jgi:hypothetical protein